MIKIFFILCFLSPFFLFAQDDQFGGFIDSLMAPANHPEMPGSYLLVAKDGRSIIRKAYGMANLELSVPAKPEHLFTLASVSKQMVAVAILQLAHKGKLSLADDITKYFPGFNTRGRLVTVEQLLTHTSGIYSETGATGARGKTLFELTSSGGVLSEAEFLQYVMQHNLYFNPDTGWGWNGYAYFMAFFIIEKASGMAFNDYMRQNIFQPAGMTNSFSKIDGNRLGLYGIKNLITTFYQRDADNKWVWRDIRLFTPFEFYERYAIATCMDDLLKWDIALRQEKLLPKEWLEKAWTPRQLKNGMSTNYGLGWGISQYKDFRLLAHPGIGTNPICTVHVPEKNLYLVYTQFYGTYEQAELVLKKIIARLLPIAYPSLGKAEAPLSEYIGVYQIDKIGLRTTAQLSDVPVYMNISMIGDTLYMQLTGTEKSFLRPAGKDKFLPARSENTWYIFKRDANGKVIGIIISGTLWTYGPDVLNKRVNVPWPKPVQPKSISDALLKKYAGTYHLPSLDIYRFIETDGIKLYNRVQGKLQELIPIANNKFVGKGMEDVTFEFKINGQGKPIMTINSYRSADFKKVK